MRTFIWVCISRGFEIPLVKVMTYRFYLIKRDFLRVFKFDSSYFWCHLRYKLTQYLIWTYLVGKGMAVLLKRNKSIWKPIVLYHTGAKSADIKYPQCRYFLKCTVHLCTTMDIKVIGGPNFLVHPSQAIWNVKCSIRIRHLTFKPFRLQFEICRCCGWYFMKNVVPLF